MSIKVTLPNTVEFEFKAGTLSDGSGKAFYHTETVNLAAVPREFLVETILECIRQKIAAAGSGKNMSLGLKKINWRKAIELFESGVLRRRGRAANPELKAWRSFVEIQFRGLNKSDDEIKNIGKMDIAECRNALGEDLAAASEALVESIKAGIEAQEKAANS